MSDKTTQRRYDRDTQARLDHSAATAKAAIEQVVDPANLRRILDSASITSPLLQQLARSADLTEAGANLRAQLVEMHRDSLTPLIPRRDTAGILIGEFAEGKHVSTVQAKYREQPNMYAQLLAPVPDQPGVADTSYEWGYLSASGKASTGPSMDPSTFARADVQRGGPNSVGHQYLKSSHAYLDTELAAAALAGVALSAEKVEKAAYMLSEKKEEVYIDGGVGAVGGGTLPGLFSFTSEAQANTNWVASKTALASATADQAYDDLADEFEDYISTFGDLRDQRFRCLMPLSQLLRIESLKRGDNKSISVRDELEQRFASHGFEGFDHHRKCADGGTGSTTLMVLYPRDGRILGYVEYETLTTAPPIRTGFETQFLHRAKCGGVACREPQRLRYAYGI